MLAVLTFLGSIWNSILYNPTLAVLLFLYQNLFHNLGLAIIALTLLIRGVLVPLTLPSLKSARKMQELRPHLEALKKKHGSDRKKYQEEQLKLYREQGINPAAGCLPNIVQIIILIALYNVLIHAIKTGGLNTHFLLWDLAKRDQFGVLPILAGLTQLLLSKMMMPALEKHPEKTEKKESSLQDTMYSMQSQMLFLFPIMTIVVGWQFPSGLVLYWLVTTLFSLVQQYFVTGLGGLKPWIARLKR